jgi:hypothetical protein
MEIDLSTLRTRDAHDWVTSAIIPDPGEGDVPEIMGNKKFIFSGTSSVVRCNTGSFYSTKTPLLTAKRSLTKVS